MFVGLTWIELLLIPGGFIASFFADEGTARFEVIQTMVGTLMLAAVIAMIVYWQSLIGYVVGHFKKPS
jgi:hypothetical protein